MNTVDAPAPDTLHGLVEQQVARSPQAVAVECGDTSLTYAELDARADLLASRLREEGVGPETVVAVYADRSLALVTALFGVLKAGAAYLPLDPGYPAARLAFMVADSGARLVLTEQNEARIPTVGDLPVLRLDDRAGCRMGAAGPASPAAVHPDNPAYVIYTSGSTGRPKGVPNTHRGIVNRLRWMRAAYRMGPDDVVLQKTPAGFDVSVWEFFLPLISGGRLVLAAPGGHKDPSYLRDLIIERAVTTAHFVPSMLTAFLDQEVEGATCLRRVICSGEELPVAAAAELLRRLPDCELHNLYGPTEAAVDVTAWRCTTPGLAERSTVPIGRAITGIRVEVLRPDYARADKDEIGELFISGVGVARGYHSRPGLTAERFIPDPWGPPGARMYRTGDLAAWNAEGDLEFHGRVDRQVKIRGQRIELGEIEAALGRLPDTRECAVTLFEQSPGDQRLVAYVTSRSGRPVDAGSVQERLRTTLPDHMVPASVITLIDFPLTPSGKLDRASLPAPSAAHAG